MYNIVHTIPLSTDEHRKTDERPNKTVKTTWHVMEWGKQSFNSIEANGKTLVPCIQQG